MWYWKDQEFKDEDIPSDVIGFVYLIENLTNGKKYIGQKKFIRSIKRVSKKTKKAKRVIKTSDWRNYFGSNLDLQNDVETLGADNFKRTIIHLCTSKGWMNYLELKEQVMADALIRDDYYNSYVGGKIHRNHLTIKKNQLKLAK